MSARSLRPLGLVTCLAGCAAASPSEPVQPVQPAIRTCSAWAAQSVVGRSADPQTLDEAKRLAGATDVRLVRPHGPLAMNFRGGRLNVEIDGAGRIRALSCG